VFNLSETQFYNIIKSPCYLCGFQSDKGIGIDRVNNLIREYSILSARPCCWTCNDFKHTLDLDSFIEKCKQISDTWPTTERFDSIPVPKNPLKDYIEKGRATETKDRKVWRAAGLYYALLSNSAQEFEEKFKEVLKPNELTTLTAELQQKTKEDAIEQLKTYIQTLKKRKQRLPPK
jgi:hypothetical protein